MNARCLEGCSDDAFDRALNAWRRPARRNVYPVRVLARLFAYLGVATAVYAVALVAVAVQSRILEF